jgi:hypothetical protein
MGHRSPEAAFGNYRIRSYAVADLVVYKLTREGRPLARALAA